LVVVESFQVQTEPVVFVAAFVAQQHRGAVILCNEQIDSAIAVIVTSDDRPRVFELNLVEADVGGDIFESIGTEITEEAYFTLAVFGFADRHEIDPTVIVIVESGYA